MEKSPSAAEAAAAPSITAPSESPKVNPSPSNTPVAPPTKDPAAADPPLSKNQLKKRRRWEKSQAIKKRRKEQARELKRIKAKNQGRDLDAERQQQLQNEKDGSGWKKREEKWKEITQKADIDNSFRVCFDCSFEDKMTWKEMNSLGLQLRYTYATNRKSTMPVYIDVCGLKKGGGGQTREHLEKVEGFPERWVGRGFRCYEEELEEVYGRSMVEDSTGESVAKDGSKNLIQSEDKSQVTSEGKPSMENEGKASIGGETNASTECEDKAHVENEDKASTVNSEHKDSSEGKASTSEDKAAICAEHDDDSKQDAKITESSSAQPYPKLRPNHKFVYLTGDSPNTLTTLDNNTTYIIGGIVDRNRLKRAAIERAESINAKHPKLNIQTARLPLDEHLDFKGSTRILTCNHVFEILQKFRENGYKDWQGSVLAVLPCRKDVEEKKDDDGKE